MNSEKTILTVAHLYKGVAIFATEDGCVIYGDDGKPIPFISETEAQAFIDAYEVAYKIALIRGFAPVQ